MVSYATLDCFHHFGRSHQDHESTCECDRARGEAALWAYHCVHHFRIGWERKRRVLQVITSDQQLESTPVTLLIHIDWRSHKQRRRRLWRLRKPPLLKLASLLALKLRICLQMTRKTLICLTSAKPNNITYTVNCSVVIMKGLYDSSEMVSDRPKYLLLLSAFGRRRSTETTILCEVQA